MNANIDITGARRRTDLIDNESTDLPPASDAATERAERAAAFERYEALVSSSPDPSGDSSLCPATPVPNPVLFVKEGTDADAVDLHDVRQDGIGDCFLMAPLAGLAGTPDGRALIKNAITENKNDQGVVVSYTVTLHRPESHLPNQTTFRAVQFTVSAPFVCGHAITPVDGNQNEVWPLVIEKAYAQYCGCYPNAGSTANAMEVLTGREATRIGLGFPERLFHGYSPDQLKGDLAAGKVVVLESRREIGGADGPGATPAQRMAHRDAHDLYGNHAYVVTGTEVVNGKLQVMLHNPWNDQQPQPIPFDELSKWFASVNIASAK